MAIPNLSDLPEITLAAEGEYHLTVKGCKEKTFSSGKPGLEVILSFEQEGDTFIDDIFYYLSYPHENDTMRAKLYKGENLAAFIKACGFDPDNASDLSAEDFIGCEITGYIVIEEGKDKNGKSTGERNVMKNVVI